MPLTDLERELLDFAGLYLRYAGAQEQESRHRFDRSGTMHWRKVKDLLDRPEALECAPTTVNRMRRLHDDREARQHRAFAIAPSFCLTSCPLAR